MVPPELSNFFLATAGAGAALIGLLFVAVSIAPEQIATRRAPLERQAVAASTFTALVNAFFISLGALIPGSLGWMALLMSSLGLLNSLTLGGHLLRHPKNWQNFLRRVFLILMSLAIYGFEFYNALRLTKTSSAVGSAYALAVSKTGGEFHNGSTPCFSCESRVRFYSRQVAQHAGQHS